MDEIFDIFLLEAIINGILFGGVLALLSLGLNLIFGVVDVVWICYAELVMFGMYTVYWLAGVYDINIFIAAIVAIGLVSILGWLVHVLIISPILGT
ncbi:MAG: branched-chain amino acid ABC transporter permease, partial [Pseudomonadota bacterium]|nr:branched-chain amino acid ABC transporter permease [Pseudomonadota bacterium]